MAPRRLSHMIQRLLHLPVEVRELPSKNHIGVHNQAVALLSYDINES
jgi:hypothetical protein